MESSHVHQTADIMSSTQDGCPQVPNPQAPEIIIDADGDLRLIVGTATCILDFATPEGANSAHNHSEVSCFLVDSKTLARACPAWKAMLCGPYVEAKPSNCRTQWVVRLPDDNPKALRMFLEIIHGHLDELQLPAIYDDPLSVEFMYEIAVLIDKYDLLHILQPYASIWTKFAQTFNYERTYSQQDVERQLWISWVFGSRHMFQDILRRLILSCDAANLPFASGTLAPANAKGMFKDNKCLLAHDMTC